MAGHAGYCKTFRTVQKQFIWHAMAVDVRHYTRSCHVCKMEAHVGGDKPASFQRKPFQGVNPLHVNLLRKYPERGNKFEVTSSCSCAFSESFLFFVDETVSSLSIGLLQNVSLNIRVMLLAHLSFPCSLTYPFSLNLSLNLISYPSL